LLTPVQTVDRIAGELSAELDAIVSEVVQVLSGQLPAYVQAVRDRGEDLAAIAQGTCGLMIASLRDREALPSQAATIRRKATERAETGFQVEILLAAISIQKGIVVRHFEDRAAGHRRAHEAVPDAEALGSYGYPPGTSHLPHMTGHIWARVGEDGPLIADNERAVANDEAWFALGDGRGPQDLRD